MDKNEVLEKARKENKGQDIAELELIRKGQRIAGLASVITAFLLMSIEVFTDGDNYYGYYMIILVGTAAMWIYKAVKLRKKHEIALAILWTVSAAIITAVHLCNIMKR